MNLSEITVARVPVPVTFTSQLLADITMCSLSEQERLLPFGIRGFRECDVQFLLWRELVLRGYEAEMEVMEASKIDIVIGDKTNRVAVIELKGPTLARDFRAGTYYPSSARADFEKMVRRISAGLPGQCYCLWIFTGLEEKEVEGAFEKFLNCAQTAASDCLVEPAKSRLLDLPKHGDERWQKCGVYAVRVYKNSTGAAVT
jgi:hypothetical protein